MEARALGPGAECIHLTQESVKLKEEPPVQAQLLLHTNEANRQISSNMGVVLEYRKRFYNFSSALLRGLSDPSKGLTPLFKCFP